MKRWKQFILSLSLDLRTDFDEGDIGLAGGGSVTWKGRSVHAAEEERWSYLLDWHTRHFMDTVMAPFEMFFFLGGGVGLSLHTTCISL